MLPGSVEFQQMCMGIARARSKPFAWIAYIDQAGLAYDGWGERVCGHRMRGGMRCNMDPDHRGRHSSVAWVCDGCGRRRRSAVHSHAPDGEYPMGLHFCFMCAGPPARSEYEQVRDEMMSDMLRRD